MHPTRAFLEEVRDALRVPAGPSEAKHQLTTTLNNPNHLSLLQPLRSYSTRTGSQNQQ